MKSALRTAVASAALAAALVAAAGAMAAERTHDVIVRGGMIYDGSGGEPFRGDVVIDKGRITAIGSFPKAKARTVVDARGKAVAPGFINMLSWAVDSFFVDPRGESDLRQGVTLEVFGEGETMGPINAEMKQKLIARQQDIKFPVDWNTMGEFMQSLEKRGVAMNIASFVGATTIRQNELGERDADPTPEQLDRMRALVRQAMEEGAVGVGSALIYAPATYAETPELVALAGEAGKCGGGYISHMRSEGDRFEEAVDELISISRQSGAPGIIYHLKAGGKPNWGKLSSVINKVEAARAQGLHVSANMYTYTAGATGLDAAMPAWVQDGGLEAWIERLKDPKIRARVIAEMRDPNPTWENLALRAGWEGTLLLGFKTEKLKPLIGKSLAEVARMRGVSPEDAAIDLVIEDGTRVGIAYFLMSEDNVKRQLTLPWVSFGSDAGAEGPYGAFLKNRPHPRAYGNFARVLGHYSRDEKVLSLAEAVRRLAALPADQLQLTDRGRLTPGLVADVVVFDPRTVADHATFANPQQFATGVSEVLVNGQLALKDGAPTGATPGRFVRGRAWTGRKGGGCRASASAWRWTG